MERVVLDVGGCVFHTTFDTLSSQPDTRLGRLSKKSQEYCSDTKEFFFDRNPDLFNSFLDFYRNGELHLPCSFCGATLRRELAFWEIPLERVSECCLQVYYKYDNDKEVLENLKTILNSKEMDYPEDARKSSSYVRVKRAIWLFLDQPKSSFAAKMFSFLYFFVVVLSIMMFLFASHPLFRYNTDFSGMDNVTLAKKFEDVDLSNPKIYMDKMTDVYPIIMYLDRICLFFFTIELILHFFSCPYKNNFFGSWMNTFDTALVMAMMVTFIMELFSDAVFATEAGIYMYLLFKAVIICRLFRLFRLVKQYSDLQILFVTLKSSVSELALLFVSFLISVTVFAGFVYYAEYRQSTTMPDLFIAIWWAIITMTTVGYGDEVPNSFLGRVVGATCSMCGILLLSMPVAIVASTFNDFHTKNKDRQRYLNRNKHKSSRPVSSDDTLKLKRRERKVYPDNNKYTESNVTWDFDQHTGSKVVPEIDGNSGNKVSVEDDHHSGSKVTPDDGQITGNKFAHDEDGNPNSNVSDVIQD